MVGASKAMIDDYKLNKRVAFFAREERQRPLVWEANSWIGTKFHAHARVKGVGVDCVQLAAAIYIAAGFMDDFRPEWYPMDGGHHDATSRVLEWVESSGKFARVKEPRIGDLLCLRLARVEHHVGVMVNERQFVHALWNHHVTMAFVENFKDRITAVYRPMALEGTPALQHLRD